MMEESKNTEEESKIVTDWRIIYIFSLKSILSIIYIWTYLVFNERCSCKWSILLICLNIICVLAFTFRCLLDLDLLLKITTYEDYDSKHHYNMNFNICTCGISVIYMLLCSSFINAPPPIYIFSSIVIPCAIMLVFTLGEQAFYKRFVK